MKSIAHTLQRYFVSLCKTILVLSQEKRQPGVVTGKDLIELLPIDENLSKGNGNKDPVQHALILPNVRMLTDIYFDKNCCHIPIVMSICASYFPKIHFTRSNVYNKTHANGNNVICINVFY